MTKKRTLGFLLDMMVATQSMAVVRGGVVYPIFGFVLLGERVTFSCMNPDGKDFALTHSIDGSGLAGTGDPQVGYNCIMRSQCVDEWKSGLLNTPQFDHDEIAMVYKKHFTRDGRWKPGKRRR